MDERGGIQGEVAPDVHAECSGMFGLEGYFHVHLPGIPCLLPDFDLISA